jgi:excisionase family DNA binding protein
MKPDFENRDPLMTIVETSRYLNVSTARIRREIYLKRIPYLKLGASIRFSRIEIDKWLSEKVRVAE